MKAAIIGASEEALHTIEKARQQGITTIAVDGNPKAAGLTAADEAMVVDISDEKATIRAMKEVCPDCLLTVPIGRYLTTIGAVNDALGLPGISKAAATLCTDKYQFHQTLAQKGLRDGYCYLISDKDERNRQKPLGKSAHQVIEGLRYPAILKPRYGSGSRGIYFLQNNEEQQQALAAIGTGEDYILEQVAPGEEYGVDGVVIQGHFHMILLRRKINTPPPARQAVGYLAMVPREHKVLYDNVTKHMANVSQALNLQECLFHADLMIQENRIFVIELSARPSGHNLHNLFTPLATGVDMAEQYICYRAGMPYDFTPHMDTHMLIHYFDLEGKVKKVPTEAEVTQLLDTGEDRLLNYHCAIKPGDVLCPVTTGHSLMGRGYFILSGSNEKELLQTAALVKNLFQF